ncbi:YkvA family protein [Clostridium pasteurianum]|uniref:DUF1232 domain-containing protein n=1 Tax=Clostridium pasteurianum BC1 TaxID=86416 RepID=R4JYS2_CLOPA|nr:YkvA family protein [Clostridium pasteurianum]AGK95972.1 hypothetical protein Clopa_0956 [Clostridium pasteurianum BC1]
MKNKLNKRYNMGISIIMKRAKKMKKEIGALYFAYKRPDVPFYAKLVSILVVCYALSPIDLIPDFIPILGYVDDLIILPLGIAFAIKLIPSDIMNECRQQSENIFKEGKPKKWIAGVIIICIWIIIISYILMKIIHSF